MDEVMTNTDECQIERPRAIEERCYENVRIEKAENGFMLRVGCKKFVAKTWKEVSEGLALYWKDPEKAQKTFLK